MLIKGEEFERPNIGPQNAVCAFVCDIGTQMRPYWKNNIRHEKPIHQIVFGYELEQVRQNGSYAGTRFVHSEFYTASISSNAFLRKHFDSWFPQRKITPEDMKNGIDFKNFEALVGKRCTVNLSYNEKRDKMKLEGVMPAMPTNQLVPTFTEIPNWVLNIKAKSQESAAQGFGMPEQAPSMYNNSVPQTTQVQNAQYAGGMTTQNNQPSTNIQMPPPPQDDLPF